MEPRMLLAQVLGFAGTAIAISSFQCRESKKLFLVQIISTLVFSVHYLLLALDNPSASTGMILNLAGMVRAVFLFFWGEKMGPALDISCLCYPVDGGLRRCNLGRVDQSAADCRYGNRYAFFLDTQWKNAETGTTVLYFPLLADL